MKKYVCMADGCDFISKDANEAENHMSEKGADHTIVEVWLDEDGLPMCQMHTMEGGSQEESQ